MNKYGKLWKLKSKVMNPTIIKKHFWSKTKDLLDLNSIDNLVVKRVCFLFLLTKDLDVLFVVGLEYILH